MYEAGYVRRANIACDYTIAIHQYICIDRSFIAFVVGYRERVSGYVLPLIFGKIQSLLLLQLVVGGKDFIEFRRNVAN